MEAMTYDPKRVATKYSRCMEESAVKKEGLKKKKKKRRKASLWEVFVNAVKSSPTVMFDNDI